jgi:hypothetical protein
MSGFIFNLHEQGTVISAYAGNNTIEAVSGNKNAGRKYRLNSGKRKNTQDPSNNKKVA